MQGGFGWISVDLGGFGWVGYGEKINRNIRYQHLSPSVCQFVEKLRLQPLVGQYFAKMLIIVVMGQTRA
eukprot:9145660-Karenia_brevis.AAC.1